MQFGWPWALLALLLVPILIGLYRWLDRRRRRSALSYSQVALIRAARPVGASWRRHLPVGLLLSALTLLLLAGARPQARIDVPVSSSAVIVALDVSGSMCATDVDPNRLAAAQKAVRDFVRAQDDRTRIGLVVFSGFAQVAVAPTLERDSLTSAIDSLTTGRGTTIGSAILKSVEAISQINPDVVAPEVQAGSYGMFPGPDSSGPDADQQPDSSRDGEFVPEIVVLLTDGANTSGVTPYQAAQYAASQGVRVYPIGFGTTNPTTLVCSAEQLGGQSFERYPFGGPSAVLRRSFLVADEPALRQVAETTDGQYFAAKDADDLQDVLSDLPRQVEVQQRDVELGAGLVALAVLLGLGAFAAAVRWGAFPR